MEEKEYEKDGMEQLLMLYCRGIASPEECMQVERWMDESEEHLCLATEVYHINRTVSDMEILQKIDPDKAFRNVNASLNRRQWHKRFRYMERVAAVLFFPLLFLYFLQFAEKQKEIPVQMIEVSANTGSITRVLLPDSTVVCLNARSSLRYPQQFNGSRREVALEGEGYFEVVHQPSCPFIVSLAQGKKIEVLGTKFNVDAYADQSFVATTLVDGSVHFLYETGGKEVGTVLQPGQKVVCEKATNVLKLYQVDPSAETAWKDGKLIFNNTPLPEVVHQLEKTFNVHITLRSSKLKNYSFTGVFDEQTLEPILESLEVSSHIYWQYMGTDTLTHRRKLDLYIISDK